MNPLLESPEKPLKFRGVAWHTGHQKWVAKTAHHGRYITLGYFREAEDAARMVDCAAKLLRGPDAVLNFDGLPPATLTTSDVHNLLVRRGILRVTPR